MEILENNFFPNLSILISNIVNDLKERKWNVIVVIFLLEIINNIYNKHTYVHMYPKGKNFSILKMLLQQPVSHAEKKPYPRRKF